MSPSTELQEELDMEFFEEMDDDEEDEDDDDGNLSYVYDTRMLRGRPEDLYDEVTEPIAAGLHLRLSGDFGKTPRRPPAHDPIYTEIRHAGSKSSPFGLPAASMSPVRQRRRLSRSSSSSSDGSAAPMSVFDERRMSMVGVMDTLQEEGSAQSSSQQIQSSPKALRVQTEGLAQPESPLRRSSSSKQEPDLTSAFAATGNIAGKVAGRKVAQKRLTRDAFGVSRRAPFPRELILIDRDFHRPMYQTRMA